MPPPNPRILKLKKIVSNTISNKSNSAAEANLPDSDGTKIQQGSQHHAKYPPSELQKENISYKADDWKLCQSTQRSNDTLKTKSDDFLLINEASNRVDAIQKCRKTRSLSSSSSESEKDFSPASDDDKEYRPSSGSDSSISSEKSKRSVKRKGKLPQLVKSKTPFSVQKLDLYQSSFPASDTGTGILRPFTSSSSASSSSGSSSDSDSSSSHCCFSDTDTALSVQDEKKMFEDQRKNRLQLKNHESRTGVSDHQPLSALQLLANEYTSSLSDQEENNMLHSEEPSECIGSHTEVSIEKLRDHVMEVEIPISGSNSYQEHEIMEIEVPLPEKHQEHEIATETPFSDQYQERSKVIDSSNINSPLPLKVITMNIFNNMIGLPREMYVASQSTIEHPGASSSPKKSRKRKRGSNKRVLAMKLRNMGLEYKSAKTNAIVPAREMGSPCSDQCRLKCYEKLTEPQRKLIFDRYWNLGSLSNQREFIAKHITEVKPKYQYKKIYSNRKSKHAFYLTVDGKKHRVCKIFFKKTLGINDRPIRTVTGKLDSSGMVEPDLRGKHEKHNQVKEQLIDGVRRHINSIPRIESHYLRKQTKREFIEGGQSLTDLYNDYKKECQDKKEECVKIHAYRKIFNEDFNISFFVPKKDQCSDCVAYQNAEPSEKEKFEENYRSHLLEKEKSREEKANDKQAADSKNIVACYDLQAILQVPKGDVSGFYYKSRMNCLNFTICELKNDYTECYFWTEIEGQKGANEIGSCVFRYLQEKSTSASDNLSIIFYSDNCCGQQKNQFIFSMYIYAVKNLTNIKSITHKFLIKGHTQNEGDSVHSTIERQVKKTLKSGPIYVPDQYINAIREAKKKGKKYVVKEMSHSEFYDIKNLQEFKLQKNTEGEQIKINDIKIISIKKAEDDSTVVKITYKTSYLQEEFKEIKLQRQKTRPHLKKLYSTRIPLAERKKEDLKALIRQRAIPPYYASSFYNSIIS